MSLRMNEKECTFFVIFFLSSTDSISICRSCNTSRQFHVNELIQRSVISTLISCDLCMPFIYSLSLLLSLYVCLDLLSFFMFRSLLFFVAFLFLIASTHAYRSSLFCSHFLPFNLTFDR